MKTTFSKLFALIMIFIGALLVSCNNQDLTLDNSKISSRTINNSLLVDAGYDEDEFCLFVGKIHNEGVEYVMNRMENEGHTYFEFYGRDLDKVVDNYLSELQTIKMKDFPDCDFETISKILSENGDFNINDMSADAQLIFEYLNNLYYSDIDDITSLLGDLYVKCNGLKDDTERLLLKSFISVAKSSYIYWRDFDYAYAHKIFTPQELLPYLPLDYNPFTCQISDRTKRIANADIQKFVKAFGFGTMGLYYIEYGLTPQGLIGLALICAIIAAHDSYDMYEKEMEAERLRETPKDAKCLYNRDGVMFNYLRLMYLDSPDLFINSYDGKFNFLIPLF